MTMNDLLRQKIVLFAIACTCTSVSCFTQLLHLDQKSSQPTLGKITGALRNQRIKSCFHQGLKSTTSSSSSSISSNSNSNTDNDEIFMDADSLGIYTEKDFECLTEYEWEDPNTDPNIPAEHLEYIPAIEVDEEGIEKGWTPYFGASNPIDTRTVITPVESFMVDPQTRDDDMVTPMFYNNNDDDDDDTNDNDNAEMELLEKVQQVRKDLKRADTFIDPWLNEPVPRHVAKWYGYPEETSFPKKDFMNNRFTKPEDKTDFTKLSPYRARKQAVEMARSRTNEWLPEGTSRAHKLKQQAIYQEKGILVGSLKKGEMDKDVVKKIQPALNVLGSCAELLQISKGASEELTVFRFHYKGAMKNRKGMAAWTETLIRDCGVECTGVVFETGGRKKDKHD